MREWIQTGAIVVGMVVLVVFVVLGFNQMQASNQAILTALQANSSTSSVDPTMTNLEIEVRRGGLDGPVARGIEVWVVGTFAGDSSETLKRELGEDGRTSLALHQGNYRIELHDNAYTQLEYIREISAIGGSEEWKIVAPPVSDKACEIELNLPEGADDALARLLTSISWEGPGEDGENKWSGWVILGEKGSWNAEAVRNNGLYVYDCIPGEVLDMRIGPTNLRAESLAIMLTRPGITNLYSLRRQLKNHEDAGRFTQLDWIQESPVITGPQGHHIELKIPQEMRDAYAEAMGVAAIVADRRIRYEEALDQIRKETTKGM